MLDTTQLTLQGIRPTDIKNHERWQFKTSSDGEMLQQQAIVRMNETPDGYIGTFAVTYDAKNNYLNLSVSSLPALIHGTSFETLQASDMPRIGQALQDCITPYAHVDVSDMIFTRIDNSTLYTMQQAAGTYIALLDDITRSAQYRHNKTYYQGETIQMRCNKRTIGFYDKVAKNKLNKLELKRLKALPITNTNLLRYEIQNKSSKSIRDAFLTDVQIHHLTTDEFVHALHEQRKKEFDKHFKFVIGEKKTDCETLLNTIMHMKTQNKRNALDAALWHHAIEQGIYTLDDIRKVMEISGYSRQAIHKRMKTLKELAAYDVNKTELLHELKRHIHAA